MNEETKPFRRGEKPFSANGPKGKKTGAGVCLISMLAVALLLLLMAYFMQQRTGSPTAAPIPAQMQTEEASSPIKPHIFTN